MIPSGQLTFSYVGVAMTRAIVVALNGVYQQNNVDFVAYGHTIVFKQTPSTGSTLDITAATGNEHNRTSYTCTGTQTTFNLPAFPRIKFEVIPHTGKDWVPAGYVVIDVDHEIEAWITDSCPPSDWKWADLEPTPIGTSLIPGQFGMIRMIARATIATYIATRWGGQ